MNLPKPENNNYCATVVRIKNIIPLQNCDNVVATTIFGFQAIVGKDVEVGALGIVFSVETQLSEAYCKENNMFRHAEFNKDPLKKGYLEDNRRIKAVKFRGHTSNALFMPLESLNFATADYSELKEGNEFDKIDDIEICKKYVVPMKASRGYVAQTPKEKRVDSRHFPEHFSTDNYFKNDRNIAPEQEIIITQKLHGTSIRIANTIVKRKLSLRDKIAKFFGATIKETEFSNVFGSRKVLKDPNNPDQVHYYDTDIWTTEGKKLEGLIPEGFLVFGELIGWTEDGKPIQTGYTYCLPKGTCRLYVYRVAIVNERGRVVDLSWNSVKQFCAEINLSVVPELGRLKHEQFVPQYFLDKRYKEQVSPDAVPLDPDTVDEGICIRVDDLTPKIYKAKSPKFFEHETKLLDKGEVDLETAA